MKKLVLTLSITAFAITLLAQDAFGGAWTVPKHKVWGEYYFRWHWAKEQYGEGSKQTWQGKSKGARSWGWVMEPKIEFGVTDWFNVLWSMEYKEAKYKEYDRPLVWGPFRRKNHGITAVKVGTKVRFVEKPVIVSGQLKYSIYPGYGNFNGDDLAYRHQPSIGDGDESLEFRALMGKCFKLPLLYRDWSLECYGNVETGYRWRSRDVNNDIPFLLEGGFWLFKWLLIKGEVDGYWSHDGTGNTEKDYAIWRVGPVFQFLAGDPITKKGVMFNIEGQYGNVFWGRNTDDDQELVLKVQTQF